MPKKKHVALCISFFIFGLASTSTFAGVTVSSPANGSTVGSSVNIVASANTACSKGVASMGIYPAPYWLVYTVGGANLNTKISLNPGTYNVVVEEWTIAAGRAQLL